MKSWIDVVTSPLGLGGFALFLVFAFLARRGTRSPYRWLPPAAVAMACVALFGGLWLAYSARPGPVMSSSPGVPSEASNTANAKPGIGQSTVGPNSPAIAGVGGSVTITSGGGNADASASTTPRSQLASAPAGQAPMAPAGGISQSTQGRDSAAISNVQGDVTVKASGKSQ